MHRLSIAAIATASAVAFTQMASAADLMPRKAPAYMPPAPPVLSWTGWYGGLNGGYAWSTGTRTLDSTITSDFPDLAIDGDAFTTAGQTTLDPKGGFGGGQLGYNWQRGHWVFGWEVDFQGASIKASRNFAVLANGDIFNGSLCLGTDCDDATALSQASSKLNVFGSFRGRVGFLATPTWLIYGTGGLAFGQVKDTLSVVSCDCNDEDLDERILPLSARSIESNTAKLGYTVGGGLEWMFAPSWSVKAEYQYIDLGSTRLFVTSDNSADHAEATANFDHKYHTVRFGLNYHFGP
jgi:outer membrane immunogenic protein